MTAEPEIQQCPVCGWQGAAHVYNLVWTREWACPSCARLQPARPSTGDEILVRLEAMARRTTGRRGRRARSLADALTDVLERRTAEREPQHTH